jgi:hypothetical protein
MIGCDRYWSLAGQRWGLAAVAAEAVALSGRIKHGRMA